MRLLLASTNRHKLDELAELLEPLGVQVEAPAPGALPPVEEDRDTFAGNAEKKALSAARASGLVALADDSGLVVDALDGAPGVRSARYAGADGDDAANNTKLLRALDGVPDERRGAAFVCALVVASPAGVVLARHEARTKGRILTAPRGSNGFGYDPLFASLEDDPELRDKTFAELPSATKSRVSHRGRALRALAGDLPRLFADSPPPVSH